MKKTHTTGEQLLSVQGLQKTYGDITALGGINFSLAPGEFLTLLGPSGSGKTTTLMSIAGFVTPTAGDIFYNNKVITQSLPEDRGFGMVFQGYALFPHLTVEQNVRFPLAIRGIPTSQAKQRASAALEQVQLGAYAKRYPKQLSGGQQQRVALARALVYEPDILLLDEPLSALDKKLRSELQWELKTLNQQSATSFLYVTHDQEEALSMSDRIAIFDNGKIVQIGTPSELYERPTNLFVAGFLGKSNMMDANVIESRENELSIQFEGGVINVPKSQVSGPGQGEVSLIIRPHKLRILPLGGSGLKARVEAISYVGNLMNYFLRTAHGTTLFVEQMTGTDAAALTQGSEVSVVVDATAVSVLEARAG